MFPHTGQALSQTCAYLSPFLYSPRFSVRLWSSGERGRGAPTGPCLGVVCARDLRRVMVASR
eukprot:9098116-Lingulodinium_polyedra.AAC.1